MRARLFIALGALVAIGWAVPNVGTAHFHATAAAPRAVGINPVRLRLNNDRGLLVTGWINGSGPYVFAIDTGAGMNLITSRISSDARLQTRKTEPTVIGGLTNASSSSNREAFVSELSLGNRNNIFRAKSFLVVNTLAPGVDGILDPTDVYAPNGYSIDLPNERIETVLISSTTSNDKVNQPVEGAVVPWVRLSGSIRPFVRLGDGRLALIDTGSGFGLGVNERHAVVVGPRRNAEPNPNARDIAGGVINSRRVAPTTISIGGLVLRRIPTDILSGVTDDAPLILGRDALYPFKITFDPQRRLIEFVTSEKT